jgi:hypothetical protein
MILAKQLPSMNQGFMMLISIRAICKLHPRILPAAKINFVSEELASQGFTHLFFIRSSH